MSLPDVPFIESPFFSDLLSSKELDSTEKTVAQSMYKDGYAIIPEFFASEIIDAVKNEVDQHFPADIDTEPKRHSNLWKNSHMVKQLAIDERILDLLRTLYGRNPQPYHTLNFKYGTEQSAHSDTVHFNCKPAKFMVGVWVAFEEINEKNGGLYYYPGSHKLPEYSYQDFNIPIDEGGLNGYPEYEKCIENLIDAHSLNRDVVNMKKGDILIWSSNLLHGGLPVLNRKSTRWSQVTHYFFEDCIYYAPRSSNLLTHELNLIQFTNIESGKTIKSSIRGSDGFKFHTGNGKYFMTGHLPNGILKDVSTTDFLKIILSRMLKRR